jgi:hypothetical protein
MILRTRLPFLCNMATTTCKPAAEPVLPLVRTVPENVQSRDTFCLNRLSRRSDSGATSSTCPRCSRSTRCQRRAKARLCVAITTRSDRSQSARGAFARGTPRAERAESRAFFRALGGSVRDLRTRKGTPRRQRQFRRQHGDQESLLQSRCEVQ